jgi:4a-hydroxytetrahydrobiopterin dehydratase
MMIPERKIITMSAIRLTEDEIPDHLAHLPGWTRSGDTVTRQYIFSDFGHALDFVNAVGKAAEDVNHHPDIDIRYHKVTLALTTHSAGGLTLLDMQMAAAADGDADALDGV